MAEHQTHDGHGHTHGAECGHPAVRHGDHTDYLHDGHLHHAHGDHVDECRIAVGGGNPEACTPSHACSSHDAAHQHGSSCSHHAIPHGGHVDYLVGGHLHHPHGGHCDDHGAVSAA